MRKIVPYKRSKPEEHFHEDIKDNVEEFNTHEKIQSTLLGNNAFQLHKRNIVHLGIKVFRPQPVDVNSIVLTIKDINDSKSVGTDNIPLKFIMDALYGIAFYLTIIINTSIVTGVFPTAWKHTIVVPIFKAGDVDNVGNFRSISLPPILSKFLEKNIADS